MKPSDDEYRSRLERFRCYLQRCGHNDPDLVVALIETWEAIGEAGGIFEELFTHMPDGNDAAILNTLDRLECSLFFHLRIHAETLEAPLNALREKLHELAPATLDAETERARVAEPRKSLDVKPWRPVKWTTQ